MDLLIIIAIVFALYWRTMDYCYLIDDIVRRWGYLLVIPETSPPPHFFNKENGPSKWRHLFLTCTHAVIVSLIYFLWGWKPALIFAVHPLAASCTAWVTGGYYQVTTLFTLTSYFFLVSYPGLIGAFLGALFFTAALGSTLNCIAFPFIFLVLPPITGLALFWPLAFYLKGRRFRIGFRKRDIGKGDPLTIRKAVVVPKVLAYYIKNVVFPKNLAFFRELGFEYGKDPKVQQNLESVNYDFWEAVMIILTFCSAGFYFSPLGTFIFLAGILPFTQWKVLGQFVAERYLYLPLTGYSLILGNLFSAHPIMLIPMAVVVALLTWRTHKYIPSFKNIETLYQNGIEQFPKCISNYVNLAERRLHLGKFFDAYKLLMEVLKIDPNSFLGHANMAAYWLGIRRPKQGLYHTRMAMKYAESRGMAYNVFKKQQEEILKGIDLEANQKLEVQKILDEMKAKTTNKQETLT